MKIKIGDSEYSMTALDDFGMLDLLELKKQADLTIEQLRERLDRLGEMSGDDSTAILSDTDLIVALGAVIWLMRRKAGETLTFDEAINFPLRELTFVAEDGDDEEAADAIPKAG